MPKRKDAAVPSPIELWVARNASLDHPLPICPTCGMPFDVREAGFIDPAQCSFCESHQIETLIRALVNASSRAETVRALEAILALAH
jgi:hypothetical protein